VNSVPTIETARLRLRAWEPTDVDAYAVIQADPLMRRYVGNRAPLSYDESRAEIVGFEDEWRRLGHGRWAIEERASEALIGACGILSWQEGTHEATGEIAYGFGQRWWGRGYATEAARASIDWAFATFDFPEVVALTNPDNVASQRVLAKLGFVRAGDAQGRHHLMNFYRVSRDGFRAASNEPHRATSD
jgi:RimJ/RimL family protein N-acetyltransferase